MSFRRARHVPGGDPVRPSSRLTHRLSPQSLLFFFPARACSPCATALPPTRVRTRRSWAPRKAAHGTTCHSVPRLVPTTPTPSGFWIRRVLHCTAAAAIPYHTRLSLPSDSAN